uniref:Thioredoxin domain-containing protein n=1 Tax=Oryza meridionalis TaxID=40149 RepID=A0A0E0FAC9_9ORYZ
MALETCFRAWATLHAPQPPSSGLAAGGSRDRLLLAGSSNLSKRLSVASSSPLRPASRFACQCSNAVDEVVVADEKNWDSMVLGSEAPVLVEFWAPWCGPCRMIAPVIDELAKEYVGKIKCCKVNTDDSPNIATNYGIRSIPTVLMFKNGEKKESVIGAVPKTTLATIIDKYVSS